MCGERLCIDDNERIIEKSEVNLKENECPFSQLDILSQANTEYEDKIGVCKNKVAKSKNEEIVAKPILSYENIIEVLPFLYFYLAIYNSY